MGLFLEFLTHPLFLSVFFAWLITGLTKYLIAHASDHEQVSFAEELFKTGGMPSAHSAVVSAAVASVFFLEGLSSLFFVAAVFGIIVIRDSFGVRWSVGEQAAALNRLLQKEKLHEKVKVVMGHTLLQAVLGIVLGVIVSMVVHIAV